MNLIGIIAPKIVSLLTIWIPAYDIRSKLLLTVAWTIKLVVDYDSARPANSGNVDRLTNSMSFEAGEIVVACIQLLPALIFIVLSFLLKAWIPCVPGVIAVTLCILHIIHVLKEALVEKKRRSERNANTNYK